MPDWIAHEPIAWTALVDAVVVMAVAFGAPITTEQKTAISAAVVAVSAMFMRSKVTPVAKLEAADARVFDTLKPN